MKSMLKLLAPLAVVATLFAATPAYALSDWLATDVFPAFSTRDESMAIPANKASHFIYIKVGPLLGYRLYDINTNVGVASGNSGVHQVVKTVWGLYGSYKLTIHGLAGYAYISNT